MALTAAPPRPFRTLQLGMSWLPEQAGNGLDRMYYGLARHLPAAGVEVRGLVAGSGQVARSSDRRVAAFAPADAPLARRLVGARRAVREALADGGVDLVATHFALYTFPALPLPTGLPLVVHFHGPWAEESRVEGDAGWVVRAKAWLERRVYRRGARFIVLSTAFRDVLVRRFGVPEARIHIVPGGVHAAAFDTGLSRREARHRLGWPADRPTVVAVRRLARRMGLENLIDAFDDVRRTVPDALLCIAGSGPLEDELQARIARRGLEDHVRLLGFVPEADLPLAYRAATVSIVPTVALEGFGLITVESMAAGTPVLVTPRGGLPEVVSALSPDLVLDGAAPADLASGLRRALDAPERLPSADACQTYVRSRFDWPIVAAATRRVYEAALAAG
jgi:glycosyltransferase involved in cell wall biosynthesis